MIKRSSARRDFLKKLSTGGMSLGLLSAIPTSDKLSAMLDVKLAIKRCLTTDNLLIKILNEAASENESENCRVWSPTDSQLPVCQILDKPDGIKFLIETNNDAGCHGGWEIICRDIVPGKYYRFQATAKMVGIPDPVENISPEVYFFKEDNPRPLDWRFIDGNSLSNSEIAFDHVVMAPLGVDRIVIRLIFRWSAYGSVQFSKLSLTETVKMPSSVMTFAVGSGWKPRKTVTENLNKCLEIIKEASQKGADFILLPELVLTWGVVESSHVLAFSVPGRETDQISKCAQINNISVGLSVNESSGDLVYNTGLVFDNQGEIVLKYRKVHLAVAERWEGVTPGNQYPYVDFSWGRVGMQICYDNAHLEGLRILANKGVNIALLPIMGDPRATIYSNDKNEWKWDEETWNMIMRMRALDNHLWYIIACNRGTGSCIIDPSGKIVSSMKPNEEILFAAVDASFRNGNWNGSDFYNRYLRERRPSTYSDLSNTRF